MLEITLTGSSQGSRFLGRMMQTIGVCQHFNVNKASAIVLKMVVPMCQKTPIEYHIKLNVYLFS